MKKQICKWCGKEIITKNPRRLYCNPAHRTRFCKHKKPRDEVFKPKKCIYCDKEFKYTEQNKRNFSRMKSCGSEECMYKIRMANLSDTISKEGYEHIKKRREKINKNLRNMKKKWKEEAYKVLGDKCAVCGYNIKEALEPHHLKGRARDYRDDVGDLRKALKKGTLKEEFILLCPNHHSIHHYQKVPIEELHKYK